MTISPATWERVEADRPIAFHVRETFRDGRWRVVTHHFLSREAFESELHWLNVRDRGFRSHDEEPAEVAAVKARIAA